jgi:drug/metabolite transporter (DMT)-like permease
MASIDNVKRTGKGRAASGPSLLRGHQSLLAALLVTVGASLQFVVAIEARRNAPAELLAATIALAASAALLYMQDRVGVGTQRRYGRSVLAFALGAVGLFGAPYVVLAHRYSDAPPGSEILFLTSAVWGVLLVLLTFSGRRFDITLSAGALLVLAGVAAIVGNWERPSSFSPFIRYSTEEYWMLAAGLAWASLWRFLGRSIRTREASAVVRPLAAGGISASAVALALCWDSVWPAITRQLPSLGMLLAASALTTAAAFALLLRRDVRAIAGAYSMQAAAITSLTWVERATQSFGPQPVLMRPAFAGAVVAFAGATLWWMREGDRPAGPIRRWTAAVAFVAVGLAAIGLGVPALQAHVTGLRSGGEAFEARFALMGYEVVGPWLALGIAVGVAGASLRGSLYGRGASALAAALAAWPLVAWTPLHTLTTFIPSEVQVDFGSEFASISFARLAVPFTYASLAASSIVLVGSWAARVRRSRAQRAGSDERSTQL